MFYCRNSNGTFYDHSLKRWKKEPGGISWIWKIPVVILNIFKVDDSYSAASLLEIVRKTFVYINTQAVQINDARKILLNDESINAICTQELIQLSHENDCKPIGERDETIIPLMFFDWRGETQMGRPVSTPSSLKNIQEIYHWFGHYLLGEDGSECQEIELNITDMCPPLQCINHEIPITHEDALRIREQFHETLLLVLCIFYNISPRMKNISLNVGKLKKTPSKDLTLRNMLLSSYGSGHIMPQRIKFLQFTKNMKLFVEFSKQQKIACPI